MPTNLNNKAVVWSQPRCPWCDRAKMLLLSHGWVIEERVIGTNATKEEFLAANPNARTVPQVWLNGELVGGFEQLQKAFNSDNS